MASSLSKNRTTLNAFDPMPKEDKDATTQEKFDKDRFRRDLGDVVAHYRIVAERLGVVY